MPVADRSHEILRGINLEVSQGEVHAIMGRNGSGKTTLAYALMGHPAYEVTHGEVIWKGRNVLKLSADKRSRLGMFLAFQYPTAIPGLSVASFLRTALNARMRPLDQDPADPNNHGTRRTPPRAASRWATTDACCARRCPCSSSTTRSRRAT